MENIKKAIKNRRSYYSISDKSPVSNKELKELIDFALLHVPSPFNSQSARIVLLLNENHTKLWNIVTEEIAKNTSEESFKKSKLKIDNCFKAGYGTVLFFEDQNVVKDLQKRFPLYKDNFPIWSEQSSAMHQFVIWTLLEEMGFGASLQHYNPLIDKEVGKTWDIDPQWKLIAQMPFGIPLEEPNEKDFNSLEHRSIVFE